ncbi:MAG: TIGR00341 family protein [Idiomarinaceae bacterium HL-53]|nr:MAG: TIGR00341 family protein [Idiomarinaceae bacterium HL-53]CUS47756.1 TIGR00341 family protein [Idiomarinaceae bacterium HL-53]
MKLGKRIAHEFFQKALVIHPADQFPLLSKVHSFALTHEIELIDISEDEFFERPGHYADQTGHVVALVTDQTASKYIDLAKTMGFSLGFVPINTGGPLSAWFRLPKDIESAIRLALEDDPEEIDILRCNDEVVLGMLTLGETPFLNQRSSTYLRREQSLWRFTLYWLSLLWHSLQNLIKIKVEPVTLKTEKKEFKTAITGLVAIENDIDCAAARLLDTSISVQDSRVSVVVISPKSVVQYLAFLMTTLRRRASQARLPAAISYIKTRVLSIHSRTPMKYYIDGRPRKSENICLELYPRAVRVNMSDAYHDRHEAKDDNKDTMKVDNLPQSAERIAMIAKHLPFFTHALEDDFRELFLQVRESAVAHPHYIALMVLSSIVATLGLFLNSTAVIIGAMVLAPLMAPIIAIAMGLLRSDRNIMIQSAQTIGIGVLLGLITSSLLAWMVPMQELTTEITARVQPTLLDLGVAIACGIAGAYAYARATVMRSLPGVAIAVALVPPLCVAGIGVGWGNLTMISGAGLLLLTNLVGIAGAAVLTFLALGYAPVKRARRGLAVTASLVGAIAIPLAFAFASIYQNWNIERDTQQRRFLALGQTVQLNNISVSIKQDTIYISADHIGSEPLTRAQLLELKRQLEERWESDVVLEIGFRHRI